MLAFAIVLLTTDWLRVDVGAIVVMVKQTLDGLSLVFIVRCPHLLTRAGVPSTAAIHAQTPLLSHGKRLLFDLLESRSHGS